MQRPIFKPVGTPVEELDTPCLVVDLGLLERNIETVHGFFAGREARLRPHVEAHRCPAIAHKQLDAGGTVGGVSVSTVGEAGVFAQSGFHDILVANEVVTPSKIASLCALARGSSITVAVDNPSNVDDLSEGAIAWGVRLKVLVDVDSRLGRCGVQPGRPALALAKAVARSRGLEFQGLMSYEGAIVTDDPEALAAESRRAIQRVLDTRELVERSGLPVNVVSVGGTHNYDVAASMPGVTEVPAGSYALMDARYRGQRPELAWAARVLATVTSGPEPGLAIVDAGQKAIGADLSNPVVEGVAGAKVLSLSAEHGRIELTDGQIGLGDRVWLVPWEIGGCANLYDYIHVARDGRLVGVWDVAARGRYR